jgi:uncharacterized protein (DUF697 family)
MLDSGKKLIKFAAKNAKKRIMENKGNKENEKTKHADTVIRNHVIWSMGAGLIPVLIADIFAVSALQLDMIRQLCRVYDVDFSETQGKAIVTSLTSSTVARITAGSVIKLIPGVGSLLGGVTVSIFAGASTYALGEVFKKHFDSGGTILDFDPARLKKLYKEKFEKGKKFAQDLQKKNKNKNAAEEAPVEDPTIEVENTDIPSGDALEQLQALADLKEKGVINEEEFEKMKKKIVDGF